MAAFQLCAINIEPISIEPNRNL